jgi:hypothetical protein
MDPRLSTDIKKLSTDDLVICWAMLRRLARSAAYERDERGVREFRSRLNAIDDELNVRQTTIDDELVRGYSEPD